MLKFVVETAELCRTTRVAPVSSSTPMPLAYSMVLWMSNQNDLWVEKYSEFLLPNCKFCLGFKRCLRISTGFTSFNGQWKVFSAKEAISSSLSINDWACLGRHGVNQVGHALAENKKMAFYGYRVLVLILITDSEFSLFFGSCWAKQAKEEMDWAIYNLFSPLASQWRPR